MTLITLFFAILGLSFLIFIHELGHYLMARHVGMRVETFAIGFGKAVASWKRGDTTWQIGWIPFGGYVKIAGSETDSEQDPYDIPDGFFGRPPIDRIKVLLAGPLANLLFALVAFTGLWMMGGREKNFSEYTPIIGWVDPKSELFEKGIRPGDEIHAYNSYSYRGAKDHLYGPMTSDGTIHIEGLKVDYTTGDKKGFDYEIPVYSHPDSLQKGIMTSGILYPANYINYNTFGSNPNPLPENSPLKNAGLEYGDRILWVDGVLIFSGYQLNQVLNDSRSLVTIQRGNEHLLRRVPRVEIQELKMDNAARDELIDWQFEAHLNTQKTQKLAFIPYNLTNGAVVEGPLRYIDSDNQTAADSVIPFADVEEPLKVGDRIIAIDGQPITKSFELLNALQNHKVLVIVEHNPDLAQPVSWDEATADFDKQIQWNELKKIIDTVGTNAAVTKAGEYRLLAPVVPKMRSEIQFNPQTQALVVAQSLEQKKELENIQDPEKRHQAMTMLLNRDRELLLGLPGVQDRKVDYNPNPFQLFFNVTEEIWRTLKALFTGALSPKWISGPVGIVQVMQENSMSGVKEALYLLGAISVNLGLLNLLPLPVLDGGGIVMHGFELITRRRLDPKIMEKIIIPCAILLIGLFLFFTYNDLSRLLGKYFKL